MKTSALIFCEWLSVKVNTKLGHWKSGVDFDLRSYKVSQVGSGNLHRCVESRSLPMQIYISSLKMHRKSLKKLLLVLKPHMRPSFHDRIPWQAAMCCGFQINPCQIWYEEERKEFVNSIKLLYWCWFVFLSQKCPYSVTVFMLQPPRHACSSFYFVTTKSYLKCSCLSSIRWLICPATTGHNISKLEALRRCCNLPNHPTALPTSAHQWWHLTW